MIRGTMGTGSQPGTTTKDERREMRRLIRESRGYTDALVHDVPKREQHRQQTVQQPASVATPVSAKRKKSDAIKAKWKEKGLRIAGVQINDGMIYAGHNMADMPFPHIDEPSLLDPTFKVAEPSDKSSVKKLPQFPKYSEMTPEQRWCYIDFLAGDRSSCQDIGYAFVYLYGIERRLIVDTKKPDEVGDDERQRLVREIIRLMECFKSRSRSFYQYTTLLLLYDGTIFKMGYTNEEISSIFFDKTATKRFTYNENTDAYEYLLLARLAENGVKFPVQDLMNYCRIRLTRNRMSLSAFATSPDEFYGTDSAKASMSLVTRRFKHSRLNLEGGYPASPDVKRISNRRPLPEYMPASPSIREAAITNLRSVCIDLESLDAPYRVVSDMTVKALNECRDYADILKNKSLRGIEGVNLDTVLCVTRPKILIDYLSSKGKLVIIPAKVMRKAYIEAFGQEPQSTGRGVLGTYGKIGYATLLASFGWQPVLDATMPEDSICSYWKITVDTDIVAMRRGMSFDSKDGTQHMSQVFGRSDREIGINCPPSWNNAVSLAFMYAWFLRECGVDFGSDVLKSFPRSLYPPLSSPFDAQMMSFMAVIMASYSYGVSNAAVKECLNRISFNDLQSAVFTWCNARYGGVIPVEAMTALEKLYRKKGIDPAMVLYDYRAGDYRINRESAGDDTEFSIDMSKLAATIRETSDVHRAIDEAIDDGDDEALEAIIERDGGVKPSGPTREEGDDTPEDVDDGSDGTYDTIDDGDDSGDGNAVPPDTVERIKGIFDGGDEMPTTEFQSAMSAEFSLATDAEIMAFINSVNSSVAGEYPDGLVEVDGDMTYLNE